LEVVSLSKSKGVLIFNKNDQERNFLRFLLKTEDHEVFDTANSLDALRIVQEENIGLMLVGSELKGMSRQNFKNMIEKLRPGVSIIFISPFPEKVEEFSINIEEFLKLIKDYLQKMNLVYTELSGMKTFSHSIVDRLLQIFTVNDKFFFNNNHLVSELSGEIAVRMGLEESLVEAIQMAALLRDLGKLMIHQQILEESRRLTQIELIPLRAHPTYSVQILRQVNFPWNLDSIISQHHEYYDGSGYPSGLKGREISIGARIISVADAYYAMTTDRPYRKAMGKEQALLEIRKKAGSQFDPEVTEIFLSLAREESFQTPKEKVVLIFEREANIATMLKLSVTVQEMELVHVTNSIDAFSYIRRMKPQLIITDVEALGPEALVKFYQAVQQIYSKADFLVVAPNEDYVTNMIIDVDYIFRPVNVENLTEKIRSMLLGYSPHTSRKRDIGLSGNIEDFDLSDIIQILSLGLKTAKVEIIRNYEKGTLYMLHGKIVHASVGNMIGREAFFELMDWDEGNFTIIHGQQTTEINVTSDTMHLLLDAAKIIDEKNTAKKQQAEKSF
jgi:HD-GYP domain-containing protein (c-di-GMP phosphodiesterase class II)